MKSLDADLILAKNRRYSADPWINLLIVELDDSSTVRWAIYPDDVTFDSQTYTALPAAIEAQRETNQGRVEGLVVHVSNAFRQVSAYLENSQLLGKDVTRRIVWAGAIDDPAAHLDFTYRIDQIDVTDEVASFRLGRQNLMAVRLPRQRFIRSRCRHAYKDAHCQYPNDEFGRSTAQNMYDVRSTGSPFEKLHGWSVLNAHQCASCAVAADTNETYLGIGCNTGTALHWYDAAYDTAFPFKLLTGDFDAESYFVTTAFADNDRWAYWIVQESGAPTNWVAVAWHRTSGATGMQVLSTTSGTTAVEASTASWYGYVRIARAASAWTVYGKAASTDSWTTLDTFTRALTDPVRIGFTHAPRNASVPAGTVYWDYLRFNSGGLAACDLTLDGDNGCRAHGNTSHYGGAPAVPRGRII